MGCLECGWSHSDDAVDVHRADCSEVNPPTLAEACEVIEALLGERSMVSIAPWDAARAFLERAKARHG